MRATSSVKIFGVSAVLTVVLGVIVAAIGGLSAMVLYAILVVLEITFSFDNAVINSRLLGRLSPLWQQLFLTIGIFLAVFVVRFLLPVVIVALTANLPADRVVNLALNSPEEYGRYLTSAGPLISAFGGTFLLMLGLYYFMDRHKDIHWLGRIEKALARAGEIRFLELVLMLIVATVLYFTVDEHLRAAVWLASMLGIALQVGLASVTALFEKHQPNKLGAKHLVGWAAFASFVYLQVLDASFSFDGVIGAFAITSSVVLIMAGLGAGALWVRSLTVYMVRNGTLAKYRYLEHGAHWAILALGAVMLAKLYHIELPEYITGSLGLVFIIAAVVSSVFEKRIAGRPRKGR